ncbi:hypothetical protein ACWF7H_11630 [Peribacillus butanolivorans]
MGLKQSLTVYKKYEPKSQNDFGLFLIELRGSIYDGNLTAEKVLLGVPSHVHQAKVNLYHHNEKNAILFV